MNHPKVQIRYGIFGGERLGGRLRRELRRAGYIVTKDQREADIIIAHSAGCFWLHDVPVDKQLFLIDPPYWPQKTIGERARQKAQTNLHFRTFGYSYARWLARNLWGIYYAIRDAQRTAKIMRHARYYDLESLVRTHNLILVRNESDPWLTEDFEDLRRFNPALVTKTMPGDHDDWYFHPEPYVDLLQSIYGKR